MQKFTPFTQPREVEFFTVFTQNGERYIHLHGYTYKSDVYWANMEAWIMSMDSTNSASSTRATTMITVFWMSSTITIGTLFSLWTIQPRTMAIQMQFWTTVKLRWTPQMVDT